MKLLKCSAANFGSYSTVDFDFSDKGLAVISGPTGAGKSSLFDLACWTLYGITAKGGSVDDVRSWQADSKTESILTVDTGSGIIQVTRTRGRSNQNDLFWTEEGSENLNRGKDLAETQKVLEERLGVTSDLYLTAAYVSEFSDSSAFFVANAKRRRELFEQISNLSFPSEIHDKCTFAHKEVRRSVALEQVKLDRAKGQMEQIKASNLNFDKEAEKWEQDRKSKISQLSKLAKDAEEGLLLRIASVNNKINDTHREIALVKGKKCGVCGNDPVDTKRASLVGYLDRLQGDKVRLLAEKNPYAAKIELEQEKENPYRKARDASSINIDEVQAAIDAATKQVAFLNHKASSIQHVQYLCGTLRARILEDAVRQVQDSTNYYLEQYFESEFRISFTCEVNDSLSVEIQKSGYACSYTQLSKGQRGLLRLCFATSVMKAASDRASVHFDNIFFDEALDGLDSQLKVRAFGLFQELAKSHGSILIVDHSPELQGMFDSRYEVTLDGDNSKIEAA
jgi:DNA repair exonuclease SbcCD ATPase subunit